MNWNGRTVLVTGAGGFIGSHLAERLVREGASVRAFVHYNGQGTRGWLDRSALSEDMEFIAGDITDYDSVASASAGCEWVFHLAALIAIPYSYVAPQSFVRTNIDGTLNVLRASRAQSGTRVIHTSTSEVYGTAQYVPIDENHPLQPQSPYSASKISADMMAKSFHLSFGVPVTIGRPFNTFGPRQSLRAVIPSIILQCQESERIRLGHLSPTRDLNFVEDTVGGFLALAGSDATIGADVNLGSGREISIKDLATLIATRMGRKITIETEMRRERPEKSEVERLLADAGLANELVGWRSSVALEDGLDRTIEWLQENRHLYGADSFTL
jgi:dTDP-glucose 4,6-dehydratase